MRYVSFSFLQMKYILFDGGEILPVTTTLKCAKQLKIKSGYAISAGTGFCTQAWEKPKASDSQNQIRSGWKIFAQPARWVKKCYPLPLSKYEIHKERHLYRIHTKADILVH